MLNKKLNEGIRDVRSQVIINSEEKKANDGQLGSIKFKSVNNRERAFANGVESDGEIATYLNAALEYFVYRCALSGEKFVIFDKPVERARGRRITTNLSAEHVVALSMGGNDIIPNVVPSVCQYNFQKSGYYILDWWPKAKDINGNPIYSSAKLLKLVNYMLKALKIRRDLGIKKRPREYKKMLLKHNLIDEYLLEEENAKGLISDTITATTINADDKKILTIIPSKDGDIPSLVKQKARNTKITEVMFLIDAIEVLEKDEKIPRQIIKELYDMFRQIEGEIPFEVDVRRDILNALEKCGIYQNKYTVANDLLINSGILEKARIVPKDELKTFITTFIDGRVKYLQGILTEEEIKIAVSRIPSLIYQDERVNKIEFWRKYRSNSFGYLIQRNNNSTDTLVDVLIILKQNGIDLTRIKRRSNIDTLLKGNEKKDEILKKIQQIYKGIDKEWIIGERLSIQKRKYIKKFRRELEKAGIELTGEEITHLMEKENNQQRSGRKLTEFVQVIAVLKQSGIDITKITRRTKISTVLDGSAKKGEIIQRLQEISKEIDDEWPIGERLLKRKRNSDKLKKELEEAGLELTNEELKHLTYKKTRNRVRGIVKEQKEQGKLGENYSVGSIFNKIENKAEKMQEKLFDNEGNR